MTGTINDNWTIVESEHYIFHFNANSLAEKNLKSIINLQERCFKFICKSLRVNFEGKINYYLCNSPEEVGIRYGDNEPCNAFASRPNSIYAVVNDALQCIGFHEDVHIISYQTLGRPNEAFIREGLAMYFDKQYRGINNLTWTNFFISNNEYTPLNILFNNDEFFNVSDTITYPIAGAFTEYIISLYGLDTYRKLYMDGSFKAKLENILGISLDSLESDFIEYMKDFSVHEGFEKIMASMLN